MTVKELELIVADLEKKRQYKKDVQLAKAQAEINTIQREADAYYDGLHDAMKAVRALMASKTEGE